MKASLKAGILLMAIIAPFAAKMQTTPSGQWQGTLVTPGGKLDLVFKISSQNGSALTRLDVPAQGAKDIPASKTTLSADSVRIEFGMMRAVFSGICVADSSLMRGKWTQNGYAFPLVLTKESRTSTVKRKSQEPQPPYAYNSEEVSFENKKAGIRIAGTLTLPKNTGQSPAVILITGSGAQNRDEEIMGHKPFLVLADYLTNRGIAVLRCDDRGIGGTGGNMSESTTFDFAGDVEAALTYLRSRKEINPARIGLAGHSEGGCIAPMVAAKDKSVAFIVLLAGPGLKGSDLLLLQSSALSKAAGMPENEIKKNAALNSAVYEEAIKNRKESESLIRSKLMEAGMSDANAIAQTQALLSPWYRAFLAIDPSDYLPKVKCPVLALNGKKDLQVPYKENLEAIDKLLAKNPNHQTKAFDGLNHLFQHCETGMPSEYATIEETFSPEVMNDIATWIGQFR